mmetsp:Transcript_16632/g.56516  ORF Transcript_16632/g.56516 Transcript_16632/m.56516 type:complete len:257 (-) Transcript_16632:1393-2163(-)
MLKNMADRACLRSSGGGLFLQLAHATSSTGTRLLCMSSGAACRAVTRPLKASTFSSLSCTLLICDTHVSTSEASMASRATGGRARTMCAMHTHMLTRTARNRACPSRTTRPARPGMACWSSGMLPSARTILPRLQMALHTTSTSGSSSVSLSRSMAMFPTTCRSSFSRKGTSTCGACVATSPSVANADCLTSAPLYMVHSRSRGMNASPVLRGAAAPLSGRGTARSSGKEPAKPVAMAAMRSRERVIKSVTGASFW